MLATQKSLHQKRAIIFTYTGETEVNATAPTRNCSNSCCYSGF